MQIDFSKRIMNDLKNLGIEKGDSIVVHSALGSLGKFPNKTQIVADALLEVLGDDGTLLIPTLSYETVTNKMPFFNLKNTPSCVGWLSEYFRNLPKTKRSIHPTHSVCGIGKNVDFFLGTHQDDNTPCGNNSPFKKLSEKGGEILFLGCSIKSNTSMHGIEELSIPEYLFDEELEYTFKIDNKNSYKKKYIPHDFKGFEQRYDRVLNILERKDYSYGKVLEADAYLIKSIPLWEKAHKKLQENPLYFVDKIN